MEYRREYGVFPELDIINHPFTALFDDIRTTYFGFIKKGFWGALCYPDIHIKFNKRFKKIYDKHKREWSFLVSCGGDYNSTWQDIIDMEPESNIQHNLGYIKDDVGNYYEGTFKDGHLIYGLMYLESQHAFFAGSFLQERNLCQGVCFFLIGEKTVKQVDLKMGTFLLQNNTLQLYDDLCFESKVSKNNEAEVWVGQYDGKYENGTFYAKMYDDDHGIRVSRCKYVDGEAKGSISCLEMVLRGGLLMWYTLIFYMLCFTYGLPFFLIYKYVQKKKMK